MQIFCESRNPALFLFVFVTVNNNVLICLFRGVKFFVVLFRRVLRVFLFV